VYPDQAAPGTGASPLAGGPAAPDSESLGGQTAGGPAAPNAAPRARVVINENLSLVRGDGGACYVCACGQDLAPAVQDFKEGCAVKESPVDAIGPGYSSFDVEMMGKMRFREFFCTRCGARLATEIARAGDGFLWDIELRL
jgi:hypothetical protein